MYYVQSDVFSCVHTILTLCQLAPYLRGDGLMNVSSGHGSAAKGSAKDLKVADCGSVGCHFFIPSNFFTMCSSPTCLSSAEYSLGFVFQGSNPI